MGREMPHRSDMMGIQCAPPSAIGETMGPKWVVSAALFFGLAIPDLAPPPVARVQALDLGKPIVCRFVTGQFMDESRTMSEDSDRPLEWRFAGLRSESPQFSSGGDTGRLFNHQHTIGGGISGIVLQGSGAHLFSFWPNGTAFWTKHSAVGSSLAAQQFRGRCRNG